MRTRDEKDDMGKVMHQVEPSVNQLKPDFQGIDLNILSNAQENRLDAEIDCDVHIKVNEEFNENNFFIIEDFCFMLNSGLTLSKEEILE